MPTGGDVWTSAVGKGAFGLDTVRLVHQDYTAHTITTVASMALDLSHEQIFLKFERDNTANDLAHATFQYWDADAPVGSVQSLGDALLFQGQDWVRADTQQETPVVPIPGTLLLLLGGLGALIAARRKRFAA